MEDPPSVVKNTTEEDVSLEFVGEQFDHPMEGIMRLCREDAPPAPKKVKRSTYDALKVTPNNLGKAFSAAKTKTPYRQPFSPFEILDTVLNERLREQYKVKEGKEDKMNEVNTTHDLIETQEDLIKFKHHYDIVMGGKHSRLDPIDIPSRPLFFLPKNFSPLCPCGLLKCSREDNLYRGPCLHTFGPHVLKKFISVHYPVEPSKKLEVCEKTTLLFVEYTLQLHLQNLLKRTLDYPGIETSLKKLHAHYRGAIVWPILRSILLSNLLDKGEFAADQTSTIFSVPVMGPNWQLRYEDSGKCYRFAKAKLFDTNLYLRLYEYTPELKDMFEDLDPYKLTLHADEEGNAFSAYPYLRQEVRLEEDHMMKFIFEGKDQGASKDTEFAIVFTSEEEFGPVRI